VCVCVCVCIYIYFTSSSEFLVTNSSGHGFRLCLR